MAERFFATCLLDRSASTPALTLLSGPPSCGKTSLLFQYALNCASEGGDSKVVFICKRKKLESKPPFLSQGVDPNCDVLQRIQMKEERNSERKCNLDFQLMRNTELTDLQTKADDIAIHMYIEDDDGLKKYFAAFHLHESFPSAIIIDDFGDFFSGRNYQDGYGNSRGRDLSMVRTLALCHDAIAHANEKLQTDRSCKLLLADTHQGDSPRLLFIYKRWIQCIFTIQGNSSGSFSLKNVNISGNIKGRTRIANYSIALQYLVLEEIVDG